VIVPSLRVEEPELGIREGPDPVEPGGPDAVVASEGRQELDHGVAALEPEDVGLLAEAPVLQPTLSQAATFG
jgi:hypothetical protein